MVAIATASRRSMEQHASRLTPPVRPPSRSSVCSPSLLVRPQATLLDSQHRQCMPSSDAIGCDRSDAATRDVIVSVVCRVECALIDWRSIALAAHSLSLHIPLEPAPSNEAHDSVNQFVVTRPLATPCASALCQLAAPPALHGGR